MFSHKPNDASLSDLFSAISKTHLLCVGDIMLDRFEEGHVARISPEAPIPILQVTRQTVHAGGAGNVARNLASIGVPVTLVGLVGQDQAGSALKAELASMPAIKPALIADGQQATTCKIRYTAHGQQLLRVDLDAPTPLTAAMEAQILAKVTKILPTVNAVILSDYGKGVLSTPIITTIITQAQKHKIPILVDPKGDDFQKYHGATLITPNLAELQKATQMPVTSTDAILAAARHILKTCDVTGVLVTRSEDGMSLVLDGETTASVRHFKAHAREVFDVSGAGDTVIAVTAAVLAAGLGYEKAAAFANLVAGIVVQKTGTASATPQEIFAASLADPQLLNLINPDPKVADAHTTLPKNANQSPLDQKIVTVATAQDQLAKWSRQNFKIGFTNGCFDLLHPGHVALIEQAASQCDRLVLGLNSDQSVKKLKGASRPIQDENARARVIAALQHVDLVVIFAEETPLDLITALRPDVLIKGADYTIEKVVGAKEVMAWGGRVHLADLLAGHSTTKTVANMQNRQKSK